MADYQCFLVPVDFSDHSRAALDTALDLAARLGAQIHLLHVVQQPTYAYALGGQAGLGSTPPIDMMAIRRGVQASLDESASKISATGRKVETHVVEGGMIADVIRDVASEVGADLIVMGTHGRSGLAHAFLGSVAERTLRRAPCPVLTVQSPEESPES